MARYSRYFLLEELVPDDVLRGYGAEISARMLDDRSGEILDTIREEVLGAPITINTWLWGGGSSRRGFRPPWLAFGAPLSAHRLGRAYDLVVPSTPSEEVVRRIISLQHLPGLQCISRIEHPSATPGWTHIEIGKRSQGDAITIFYP